MKKLNVVGAIIIENGRLFSSKRGESKNPEVAYKYEFVGGKIETGELASEAIVREVKEEMDLDVEVIRPFMTVVHSYQMYEVTLTAFLCKRLSDYTIKEHIAVDWLSRDDLIISDWAPADEPIIQSLLTEQLL